MKQEARDCNTEVEEYFEKVKRVKDGNRVIEYDKNGVSFKKPKRGGESGLFDFSKKKGLSQMEKRGMSTVMWSQQYGSIIDEIRKMKTEIDGIQDENIGFQIV